MSYDTGVGTTGLSTPDSGSNPTPSMADILGYANELPQAIGNLGAAVQDARIRVAMANQQYNDVTANSWTPGALLARWQALTPQNQAGLVALVAVVSFAVIGRGK